VTFPDVFIWRRIDPVSQYAGRADPFLRRHGDLLAAIPFIGLAV